MTHEELLKTFEWQLGKRVLQSEMADGDLWVRVAPEVWAEAARIAHDELGCHYFVFLSAMDWLVNPRLDGEKTFSADAADTPLVILDGEASGRKAGGSSRFQVIGRVYNVDSGVGLMLSADLDDDLRAPSWTPIYKGADWHERETWEMFGITFDGHPGLRHIYLPTEFEGHPLRKDYALVARTVRPWPGLVDMEEMPAEPAFPPPGEEESEGSPVANAVDPGNTDESQKASE